jgi:hypothetical protein
MKQLLASAVLGAVLFSAGNHAANAWPSQYAGEPLHVQSVVLVDFRNGNHAGDLSVRSASGKTQDYATTPKTTWQGRQISCFAMPAPRTQPCQDWPHQIVPFKTHVNVTYCNGDNGPGPGIPGPVRIAKDVSVVR